MPDLSFRKRHRLKTKEVKVLGGRMKEAMGMDMVSDEPAVDRARGMDMDFLIVDGRVAYLVMDEVPFPSLRTILDKGFDTRWMEVDEGAVPFLANGADCMAPGVTGADPGIAEGDWVYARDSKHHRPIVVGIATMPGSEMVIADKGKAMKTLHYVGDRIWDFE